MPERPIERMRMTLAALAMAALAMLVSPAHARSRDLGAIPTEGFGAAATLPDRQKRVIRELACGMEPQLITQLGTLDKDRPLEILNAKAAVMAGLLDPQDLRCEITQVFDGAEWAGLLPDSWKLVAAAIKDLDGAVDSGPPPPAAHALANADAIKRLLNALEFEIFGPLCDQTVSKVEARVIPKTPEVKGSVEYRVTHSITHSCLERQVNFVILSRQVVRKGNPGSSGLPCHLLGSPPDGDWDMGVAQFTRLAFLLRKAGTMRTLSAESAQAMYKLQNRLLTLSKGPAEEVHELWQCGNPDNQYGSARDRLDDNYVYDWDTDTVVEGDATGSDTGDDLLDFLALLALVIILLFLGWALAQIALLLISLLGPLLGVIALIIALAIAIIEDVPQLIAGVLFGGPEETENHLFMQNSSKYLKNKMLIEDSAAIGDTDAVEKYEDYNQKIHEWFMERLQRVARDDFAEFNAKPYGHFSFTALLNMHDFTCQAGVPLCTTDDAHLVTGVAAVADLTSAKMALGSNQGRRLVPFRRLSHTNTDYTIGKLLKGGKREEVARLMELFAAADHQIAAMQLWTGQTFHGPDAHASQSSLGSMIWEATSSYQPHRIVLDLAVNKKVSWEQTYHHAGWERYSSGPAWLITAGGTESGYAQGFRTPLGTIYPETWIKQGDRGAGVPTTLMVSAGRPLAECEPSCEALPPARVGEPHRQDLWSDFIRFEGKLQDWKDDEEDEPISFNDNFCVTGSFACGINMKLPLFLKDAGCLVAYTGSSVPGRRFSIIDSSTCTHWDDGDATNDIFVVVYQQPCTAGDCGAGATWGFIEVVTREQAPTLADLQNQILTGNIANFDAMSGKSGDGTYTYASLTNGVIKFNPHGSWVTEVAGVAQPHGSKPDWPRAEGNVVNRTGDAKYTIARPGTTEKMEIDFSNQKDPKRALP